MVVKMEKYPYNVGSAIVYSSILLASLWWLPVIGPIIIGYITGRKAGGPMKGLVAMAVPVFFYFFIIHAIHVGWIHIPPIVESYFQGTAITSVAALPFMNYVETTVNTATNIALYFTNYLYYAPPSFFIMFSFAFIGGVVSRQVILERGLYKEKKPKKVPKKNKIKVEDIPHRPVPFNAKVMVARPVAAASEEYYEMYPVHAVPKKSVKTVATTATKKTPKKSKRTKKKKIKSFEDMENSKFVVHPMEPPRNVVIKKRKVNASHSIAFL